MQLSTIVKIVTSTEGIMQLIDMNDLEYFNQSIDNLSKSDKFDLYTRIKSLKSATDELVKQKVKL